MIRFWTRLDAAPVLSELWPSTSFSLPGVTRVDERAESHIDSILYAVMSSEESVQVQNYDDLH